MLEILNFKDTIEDVGGLEKLKEWLHKKAKIFQQLDKTIKYFQKFCVTSLSCGGFTDFSDCPVLLIW
ncbi:MAG: hypothetical protein F6K62_09210 [Sphaerospermopsis sp. SIO1G2]|nr:hypothetical protein [Sphaerospermopsis sp. SIO1G2]